MRKDTTHVTMRSLPLRALACVLAVLLLATGCDRGGDQDGSATRGVEAGPGLPGTYADRATWKTEINPDVPPVVTSYGVVAVIPGHEDDPEGTYRIALISHEDGKVRWRSAAIPSVRAPSLYFTKVKGAPWVVVRTYDPAGDGLLTFDVLGVGNQVSPTVALYLRPSGKAPVRVAVSDAGILVSGAVAPAGYVQVHPDSGATTTYRNGPTSNTGAGVPILVRNDSFLVTYPKRGFAVASANGGWESRAVAPDGVDTRNGVLVAAGSAVIVALWTKPDGSMVLAVHSMSDGRVLAEQAADAKTRKDLAKHTVVTSSDGHWVFIGEFAFDIQTGDAKKFTLNGGTPVSYSRGVLYVRGATAPVPVAAEEGATDSPSATASASGDPSTTPTTSPSMDQPNATTGFTGFVGIDVETSTPLEGEIEALPIDTSALGEGIFVRDESLLSVPLR